MGEKDAGGFGFGILCGLESGGAGAAAREEVDGSCACGGTMITRRDTLLVFLQFKIANRVRSTLERYLRHSQNPNPTFGR